MKKKIQEGLTLPTKHKQIIHTYDWLKMSITSGRSGILLPSVIFIYAVCHERPWISWAIEKKNHVFTTDENVSLSHYTKQKHWQGGIDYFNSPKRKRMWAIPDLGEKCPVKSLKLFLSKTDSNATSLFQTFLNPALSPLLTMNPFGLGISQWNNTSLVILGGI